jgi:hypothetical protein
MKDNHEGYKCVAQIGNIGQMVLKSLINPDDAMAFEERAEG